MAANDTAALVVALSAQLSKFEKDMKSAVDIADKRTKEIETAFTRLNGAITGKLQQVTASLTGQVGFAGQVLTALGPAGVAAAVGLGATIGALAALSDATQRFSEKAKALKEGAETAGFTITQFKALGQAGARVGLDFDETTAFFTKYIANIEALRDGGGPLYDALLKIDVGLLRQLSSTRDSAEAVDLLAKAFGRLTDQTQKLDLARAAGGRAGLSGVRLLDSLANQGGVNGAVANSSGPDEEQIKRAARLRQEIDEIRRKTDNIWGGMFSDTILGWQKQSAEWLKSISEYVASVVGSVRQINGSAVPRVVVTPAPRDTFDDRFTFKTPKAPSPSVELALLQKNVAILGEAITQSEQLKLKKLEIAAAAEKGGLNEGVADRALAAFNVTMRAAAVATRERLSVATEDQIVQSRLAQLSQDAIKFKLSEAEIENSRKVILLESKQAADALTVRQSYLPGLKQLEQDALSVRKNLDTLAVNSVNNLENALVDVATGTKTASEAFRAMANAIIADLARIAIRQAITGSISALFGGFFGGGSIGRNAGGTDHWRGGATWVGENGPEILNLPRGSQIIPNDVVKRGGGGITVQVMNAPVFSSGMTPSDMGVIRNWMEQNKSDTVALTISAIRNGNKNDSSFLSGGSL